MWELLVLLLAAIGYVIRWVVLPVLFGPILIGAAWGIPPWVFLPVQLGWAVWLLANLASFVTTHAYDRDSASPFVRALTPGFFEIDIWDRGFWRYIVAPLAIFAVIAMAAAS